MYIGRMSRWDWLEQVAPLVKPGKPRPKREPKPKAKLKKFKTIGPDGRKLILSAYTRSEARAQLKKIIGGKIRPGKIIIEVKD